MHVSQNARKNVDRVLRRATVIAGMQVPARGVDGDFITRHTAQGRGDGGGMRVPHIGVAHQRDIRLQLFRRLFKKTIEAWRTGFFLPLKQDGDFHRQSACCVDPAATGLNERHQLPLVVG